MRQHEHQRGEIWKHRGRDRTIRVLSHEVQTDNVEVETVGRSPNKRSYIYGYNLRQQYARVDDSGVIGPMVAAEPAALRLMRALDYRLVPDVEPVAPPQVAVVLHGMADHTAIMEALSYEPDPGSPWPHATSMGRWLHDVADQVALIEAPTERTRTTTEVRLAVDTLAIAQAGGMPDSYFATDHRIRHACRVLQIEPTDAAEMDWAEVHDWNGESVVDEDDDA